MIYIDPPYNTGNDFVYRDKWVVDSEKWSEDIGQIDEETGDRLFRNTESNGRFHSDWCSMIYPRLLLARNLLRDDGVIFISIDDGEVAQLRKICDEVFGERNFCGDIIWNSTKSVTNTALISVSHTYNLVYFKIIEYYVEHRDAFRLPDDGSGFENPDDDPRGPWKADPFQVGGWRPNQQYTIVNPNTGIEYKPNPGCSWKNDYEKFQELLKDNRIMFGRTGEGGPQRKRFIWEAQERGKVTKTLWDDIETTTNGTQVLKRLFDDISIFSNPKPTGLIKRFLQLSTNNSPLNADIILDFFSGSATTAHAVMQLNAEDGGNRQFIMVQLPEPCEKDSEAFKAGYKNICEIGKERIRRAGDKVLSDKWQVMREENKTKRYTPITNNYKEELRKYGCKELSGTDCLAEGNGFNGANLFAGEEIAKRGNVRAVEPNAAGGSVDSVKHSGGPGKNLDKRVSAISDNSEGIESGTGNTIDAVRENRIPCKYGYYGSPEPAARSGENAGRPHKNTINCPLGTDHFPDTGFRVFKTASSNMKDVYYGAGEYKQENLDLFTSNIKEDRTPLDLLYGCLLDGALPLSLHHTEEKIDGFTVHIVNSDPDDNDEKSGAALIACFDENISEKALAAIAQKKPSQAFFRDAGFASDPAKINVFELFKRYAPDTKVKVL
jgi:DNA modification methylase